MEPARERVAMSSEDATKAELREARNEIARLWRAINAAQTEIAKRADACRELGDIGNARPKAQAYDHAGRIIVEELKAEKLDTVLRST